MRLRHGDTDLAGMAAEECVSVPAWDDELFHKNNGMFGMPDSASLFGLSIYFRFYHCGGISPVI